MKRLSARCLSGQQLFKDWLVPARTTPVVPNRHDEKQLCQLWSEEELTTGKVSKVVYSKPVPEGLSK